MEVVYLFGESAAVRIPFFDYDQNLFRLLAAESSGTGGGGVWNNARREFVFRGSTTAGRLSRVLSGIPCVWVEENAPVPVHISGFLERPWDDSAARQQVRPAQQGGGNRPGCRAEPGPGAQPLLHTADFTAPGRTGQHGATGNPPITSLKTVV